MTARVYEDVCDINECLQLLQKSLCLRLFTCFRIKKSEEYNEENEV